MPKHGVYQLPFQGHTRPMGLTSRTDIPGEARPTEETHAANYVEHLREESRRLRRSLDKQLSEIRAGLKPEPSPEEQAAVTLAGELNSIERKSFVAKLRHTIELFGVRGLDNQKEEVQEILKDF